MSVPIYQGRITAYTNMQYTVMRRPGRKAFWLHVRNMAINSSSAHDEWMYSRPCYTSSEQKAIEWLNNRASELGWTLVGE